MNDPTIAHFNIPQERLAELRCRHYPRCSYSPIGVYHMPKGCACFHDPVQALCQAHVTAVGSDGPITVLIDLQRWEEGHG